MSFHWSIGDSTGERGSRWLVILASGCWHNGIVATQEKHLLGFGVAPNDIRREVNLKPQAGRMTPVPKLEIRLLLRWEVPKSRN